MYIGQLNDDHNLTTLHIVRCTIVSTFQPVWDIKRVWSGRQQLIKRVWFPLSKSVPEAVQEKLEPMLWRFRSHCWLTCAAMFTVRARDEHIMHAHA